MANYGFSSVNKNLNSRLLSGNSTSLDINSLNNLITAVRVKSIILDETHAQFEKLGGWNALGAIEYEEITSPNVNTIVRNIAYPLNPNNKNYPLLNEVVYIISLPDTSIGKRNTSSKKYYINIVGLWNHPHHNGYPLLANTLPPEQQKDYQQTEAGSVRRVSDNSTEINLGRTFKERANIHPLLPFEGDIIYEGRWGNSIRLGSTVTKTPNNWSSTGKDGDPISIIRNGQGSQTNEGWIPTVENVNNDNSSIYLTSTQNVPLNASSTSYVSYSKDSVPSTPSKFAGAQILLSSGRLVFNSYNDHILLTSAKSINLNSLTSVNIDSPELSVQADKIYLGKYQAEEPLMLGIQTVNLLKDLVKSLTTFMTIASTATTSPSIPALPSTLPTINSAAQDVLDDLVNLSKALGSDSGLNDCNLTSKRNYTV
jgi:hypothetical protein